MRDPAGAVLPRGQALDRFVVLECVGEGGMGVVYAAYDPELDRKVAIKLMRPGTGAGTSANERISRFRREAKALARLSHPNVVSVFEVGTFADQIFVAMEFVQGQTARQWFRERRRSWREVLDVFLQAGRGLQATHEAGLVHRDVKPDNILIGSDGRVRLTDFGLVAAMGEIDEPRRESAPTPRVSGEDTLDDQLSSSLTESGTLLGSPAYMALEQMHGKSATDKSDQFGFCVSLYEALYGERPYRGTDFAELLGSLNEGEVRDEPPDSGVPSWLRQVLLKGLRPQPEQRHESIADLLGALSPEPRSSRRRKVGVIVALTSVFLALMIGWWLVAGSSTTCEGAEKQLGGVWDPAAKRAVKQSFLASKRPYAADTFERVERRIDRWTAEWVEHHTDACRATRVSGTQSERALDLRMRCLDRKLAALESLVAIFTAEPDALVVDRAVEATYELGSVAFCGDLEALEQEVPPPEDPAVREQVETLRGPLGEVRLQDELGKYERGAAILEEVEAAIAAIDYPPLHAELELQAGINRERRGEYEAAEESLRRALESGLRWKQWDLALQAAQELTLLVGSQLRRHGEGLAYANTALGLSRGLGDRREARSLNALATVFKEQGRFKEAEAEYRRALELWVGAVGPDHADVARARSDLAGTLQELGRYDEAAEEHRRALAIIEQSLGPEHSRFAHSTVSLGIVLDYQGKYQESEAALRRGLELLTAALGPDHPMLATAHNSLGNVLSVRGELEEAEQHLRRGLALHIEAFGEDHPDVAKSINNLGNVLTSQAKFAEAESMHRRALAIREKALGADNYEVTYSLCNLGLVLNSQGKHAEAEPFFRRSLEIEEKSFGEDNPVLSWTIAGLGDALLGAGKHGAAREQYRRVATLCEKGTCEAEPRSTAEFGMARILWHEGKDRKRALDLAEKALAGIAEIHQEVLQEEIERWLEERRAPGAANAR
jgi:serine/threonine-protein kinase